MRRGSYRETFPEWVPKLQRGEGTPEGVRCAEDLYEEMWPECTVHEIDETEGPLRDYSGMDKIIETRTGERIHLGQRFRRTRDGGVEFTLQSKSRGGRTIDSERARLRRGRGERFAHYPRLYAFGIARARSRSDLPSAGFSAFWLIETDPIVEYLVGTDREKGPFSAGSGKEFYAYSWGALDDVGAILRSWEISDLQPAPEGETWGGEL